MPELTLRSVSARAVLAPLDRPITTAAASIPAAPLVLLDIETDQGIVGRSYVFTYTPLVLKPMVTLIETIGDTMVGTPGAPFVRMREVENTFRLLGRQGLVAMALAGIDMALWDAFARAGDRTVAEALGGANVPVRAYDSYGVFDPASDPDHLEVSLERGFQAVKFKIGDPDPDADQRALHRIRELIGPDVALMVDYNQSLTAPEAIRRIRRLEAEFDLLWVEEPVPAEDHPGHQSVRAGVTTPIQTGENWWLPDGAALAIQAGISDHAMLDIMKIGGFTGWMRTAPMAAAASLPVSSHLFVEASAHALAVTPGAFLLEFMDIAGSILAEPCVVDDGCVVPRGPGLGLEWDEEAVGRHRVC